jgi:predicted ester cyclase
MPLVKLLVATVAVATSVLVVPHVPTRADPAAVVRRAVRELFTDGDLASADRNFSPESAAEERRFAERIRQAFPDLAITLDRVVQEGSWVAIHWTATGTHAGEFAGLAPTGRRATWSGAWFWRVQGTRIVDGKALNVWDQFGLRTQLAAGGESPR